MSRSYRKRPIIGNSTSDSEKEDKRIWHKAWRRIAKRKLNYDLETYEEINYRQVSDTWTMDKDGRQIVDPEKFPEVMRK